MKISKTPILGLLVVDLDVHGDARGWFKENWQREKQTELGLPDFGPVQNNISFNAKAGVTRGLHAEPWDKYVSVACGSVFGAWCDLREGSATYGKTFQSVVGVGRAVFVPRGVANGFQALEDNTAYTYLVNEHWSPDAEYSFVNLNTVEWPMEPTEISPKDELHPALEEAIPVAPKRVMVLGASGQLGMALKKFFPNADFFDRASFDIASPPVLDWREYSTIINAAAYTAVDQAEGDVASAWTANAIGPSNLAKICTDHRMTLVHVSSDYVFDGTASEWGEESRFSPLNVYGQSKAAGDIAVQLCHRSYIVRTSWVVGSGKNFVATMANLADKGVNPKVVNDQFGRLTFAQDIAAGIHHLLEAGAPYGTYNLSNSGEVVSWAEIAKAVFELRGRSPEDVEEVSTSQFFEDRPHAPRPANSKLNLDKICSVGFRPRDWREALELHLAEEI